MRDEVAVFGASKSSRLARPTQHFYSKRTTAPLSGQRIALSSPKKYWLASFISLTAYFLSTAYGTVAMALCLGIWVIYALAWPGRVIKWLRDGTIVWGLPIFAIVSAIWSNEPLISLKLGMEFLLFTAVGLILARVQTPRNFLSSFMCTVILCVVLSLVFGSKAAVGVDGQTAIIGLFGSKNNFAYVICLMMMSSMAVVFDRGQPLPMRVISMFGFLSAPALLIETVSLGALLAGGAACCMIGAVLVLSWVPVRLRPIFLALTIVMFIGFGVIAAIAASDGIDLSTLLESLGKDTSLTGRTFLWDRARVFISENPLFGIGYQAFWVQGHVEAEGLWRYALIESRMGFHFHNLYYAIAVELGLIGVAIFVVEMTLTTSVIFWAGLSKPNATNAFLAGLFLFYLSRLGVELDFLAPFASGSFLMPMGWVIARRALRGAEPS